MPNDPLLDAILQNMRENNNDPEAYDRHEDERNAQARPYDHPANKCIAPPALNPDGSLADPGTAPAAGSAAPPAAKPAAVPAVAPKPEPKPEPKPLREGGKDVWVNVPDEEIREAMEE